MDKSAPPSRVEKQWLILLDNYSWESRVAEPSWRVSTKWLHTSSFFNHEQTHLHTLPHRVRVHKGGNAGKHRLLRPRIHTPADSARASHLQHNTYSTYISKSVAKEEEEYMSQFTGKPLRERNKSAAAAAKGRGEVARPNSTTISLLCGFREMRFPLALHKRQRVSNATSRWQAFLEVH